MNLEWLIPLIALTAMEIVLGIDNIIFIAILSARVRKQDRAKARSIGLIAALVMRVALLCAIWLVLALDEYSIVVLTDWGVPPTLLTDHVTGELNKHLNEFTVKDLVLLAGGLFLMWKSVHEIHHKMSMHDDKLKSDGPATIYSVVAQIAVMDMVFSIDSVITAVGMAKELWVMIAAIIVAIGIMLVFAGRISQFVERNPTIKMLALSFLILIGVMLVAEAIGTHFDKGYIYFAMAFSLVVEMLNMRVRRKQVPSPAVAEASG